MKTRPMRQKTQSFTFRVTPCLLEALREAAEREQRSVSNLLEVLVRKHCVDAGIRIGNNDDKSVSE